MQQNITPLPWRANGPYIEADNEALGQCFHMLGHAREGSVANAAFIVKACNTHDQLVGALKDAKRLLELNGVDSKDCADYGNGEHAYQTIRRINDALAAAGAE